MSPTHKSAAARCLMKKFMRDLRPLDKSRAISTVALPITMSANNTHRNVSCSTWKKYTESLDELPVELFILHDFLPKFHIQVFPVEIGSKMIGLLRRWSYVARGIERAERVKFAGKCDKIAGNVTKLQQNVTKLEQSVTKLLNV